MSRPFQIQIESVLGGISPSVNFGAKDSFISSIGIDPDFPMTDAGVVPSGFLRPTAMEEFSGATMDQTPLWILTNPKSTNIYAYANAGDFYSYSSVLGTETLVSAVSSASGNGAEYYDNYIWLAINADLVRYGPLNASPAMITATWTGAGAYTGTSGGLTLTALTNNTYPTIRGTVMPNHPMFRHTDGKLYFGDVHSDNRGILSYVKTTKTTVEGDTNNGSTYNALDFPYGWWPTAISNLGTDLAVALMEGTSIVIRQKNAKLSFWDTTSSSYNRVTDVEFPDPLITALKNVNGILYVFSGSANGGCRISRVVGGYNVQQVFYSADMFPPLQGAVDHLLDRVVFGTATTYPEASASVFALGSSVGLSRGVHGILKTTSAGTTPYATAVKYVQNSAFPLLTPIVGWRDASAVGIDKLSTTYGTSVWRSTMYRVGDRFTINDITLLFSQAIAANMTLTVKVFSDDAATSYTVATINNTNYASSQKSINLKTAGLLCRNNFFIELRWTGTVLLTVALPITVTVQKL